MGTTSSILQLVRDFNNVFCCPSYNGRCKGGYELGNLYSCPQVSSAKKNFVELDSRDVCVCMTFISSEERSSV